MHLVLLRLSAMGDVLRALPAWKNLADAFPGARIQAVVEDRHAFLLEPLPRLEPVVVHRRRLAGPLGALRELRRAAGLVAGADASLDFHGILKSALIPYFAGIRRRWGDGCAREGAGLLQSDGPAFKRQSRYAQALGLAEAFGLAHGAPGLGRFAPVLKDAPLPPCGAGAGAWPAHDTGADARPTGPGPGRRRILLVPGTSERGANKRWPMDRWIRLAGALKSSADPRWSLGPAEAGLRGRLPGASGVEALPELPFWGLASAVRGADAVVAGDTGVLHLAVLLGVRAVALLGPSDPVVSGLPPGGGAAVRAGAECSPCRERGCLRRGCMEALAVDDVLAALDSLMA
jgi:ADP-heptose:LPS heptosyltransferase